MPVVLPILRPSEHLLVQEILAEVIEYRRKELLLLEGLKDGEQKN